MADDKKLTHVLRPRSGAVQFAAKAIVLKVGQPPTIFHVNGDRIAESSEFFKSALKKEWASGRKGIVELPSEEPEMFNVYLNWIYSRQLFLDINANQTRKETSVTEELIKAYALGDMLMDVDFKDAVTDAMVASCLIPGEDNMCWIPPARARAKLYDKTAPNAKIRQALVHRMSRADTIRFVEEEDRPAFLVDVAKKVGEPKGPKDESVLVATAKCKYHEHKEGDENCYRTKYAKPTTLVE